MGLQEEHDGANRLLLLPALAYPLNTPRAEALDLLQEGGAFVNDVEGPDAEDLNDLAGKTWPDSLDQPGAQIALDAVGGVWRRGL